MLSKITKKRKIKNGSLKAVTYIASFFTILVIIGIFAFSFIKGIGGLNIKMLTSDYYEQAYFAKVVLKDETYNHECEEGEFFSSRWGIAFKDDFDLEKKECVVISYIDPSSPFKDARDSKDVRIKVEVNQLVRRIQCKNDESNFVLTTKNKSQNMIETLDKVDVINEFYYCTLGGGIRGSLVSTLYLILLTLVIALPIGILAALYLGNYAKDTKIIRLIRSMIDMISGIPSIIFGLIGSLIFIPFVSSFSGVKGNSILAGAFTLAIMLLPIIIKNTEESIKEIPSSYKHASLALGASETQTTFKVILPNSIEGILTSTLLSIGRIIGESAALIFVMGSSIQDDINIFKGATSLAVHIFLLISGEEPNYASACAISLIILAIVLILNILLKLVCRKLKRFEVQR